MAVIAAIRNSPHPVHGSWLNMAEIELSMLACQALRGRMSRVEHIQERVAVWQHTRNQQQTKIDWHFTIQDARIKIMRLCPILSNEA